MDNVLIFILYYIGIPLGLFLWLAKPSGSYWEWFFKTSTTGIYCLNFFLIGFWPGLVFGFYFRYLLLFGFGIVALTSFFRIKKGAKSSGRWKLAWYLPYLALICLMFFQIVQVVKGSANPGGSVELSFPLKNGIYYVSQGGNALSINHHLEMPGQKYALDVLKLDNWGRRASLSPIDPHDYHIYSETLYSPCSGTVLQVTRSFEDQILGQMDTSHPGGNYIAIKMDGDDKVVVLAHLLKGSIQLWEGDRVELGQPIGQVGNSGNTSEPHLHIHCVELNQTGDFIFEAISVPMTFSNKFLVRNNLVVQ